jgi:hypothetical protein
MGQQGRDERRAHLQTENTQIRKTNSRNKQQHMTRDMHALGHAIVALLVHDRQVEARRPVAPRAALLQQRLGLRLVSIFWGGMWICQTISWISLFFFLKIYIFILKECGFVSR